MPRARRDSGGGVGGRHLDKRPNGHLTYGSPRVPSSAFWPWHTRSMPLPRRSPTPIRRRVTSRLAQLYHGSRASRASAMRRGGRFSKSLPATAHAAVDHDGGDDEPDPGEENWNDVGAAEREVAARFGVGERKAGRCRGLCRGRYLAEQRRIAPRAAWRRSGNSRSGNSPGRAASGSEARVPCLSRGPRSYESAYRDARTAGHEKKPEGKAYRHDRSRTAPWRSGLSAKPV
jgi:hypothetical protein